MKLLNCQNAVVDIAKLRDYSLNPEHEIGAHKARVFRAALDLNRHDAEWLREQLFRIACDADARPGVPSPFGQKYTLDAELVHSEHIAVVRSVCIVEKWNRLPKVGKLLRVVR